MAPNRFHSQVGRNSAGGAYVPQASFQQVAQQPNLIFGTSPKSVRLRLESPENLERKSNEIQSLIHVGADIPGLVRHMSE